MELIKDTAIIDINEYYRLRRTSDAIQEGKVVTIFKKYNEAISINFLNPDEALIKAEEAVIKLKESYDQALSLHKSSSEKNNNVIEELKKQINLLEEINLKQEKQLTDQSVQLKRRFTLEDLKAMGISEIRKLIKK
jgi:translation initiation factor 2 alpha subunit (eIF-2alpha)